ncbi:hypothetical protein [Mesorhizobium sp. M0227]|uniref:hypothetical protein n=1 Tax=Mesorhizobium sp. M0227 TaxID=2956922 RepID=UPI00333CFF4D
MIEDSCLVEDAEVRLRFSGDSAMLCAAVFDAIEKVGSVEEIASQTGYSIASVNSLLDMLSSEDFVLNASFGEMTDARSAIERVRSAGRFWNKHVMCQRFPLSLFGAHAIRDQVLGWGIEFYIFVRAAREYMARGASRIDGPTASLGGLWSHFAEEAFHDEIFRRGLIRCGLSEGNINNRVPLPSTMGLLNHLWEAAEGGELQYASVFALMQPLSEPATSESIVDKYRFLKKSYPFASPLFEAFQTHDGIDVDLGHSHLSIEPLMRDRGMLSAHEMQSIFKSIRRTSDCFDMFFSGIQSYYGNELSVSYRQVPTVGGAILASGERVH